MTKYLTIPSTGTILYSGSVVILSEYPGLKWITKHGWYTYNNFQYNGWYFRCISDGTIVPSSEVNLANITVVSTNSSNHHGPAPLPPNIPSGPGISPKAEEQVKRAFITVDSIKQRDALDDGFLPDGKLVRVNNVEGETKYYEYDTQTMSWIELPSDMLTKTDGDQLYVLRTELDWETVS